MQSLITEGKAKAYVHLGKISRKLEVFYNPVMKHNRDITVLVLKALKRKNLVAALPLEASGIRGIRIIKEVSGVTHVFMNDGNPKAAVLMKKNLNLNIINGNKITVFNLDADQFFQHIPSGDYIDIDPFGSPTPFLDAALKKLRRGGILAVTATDLGALAGTFPVACRRKYWAEPLYTASMHESGIRILIRRVQLVAASYDRALLPVFSYFKDHYYRVFFIDAKGKANVDRILKQHGLIAHAGPMWKGLLWDARLVNRCAKRCEDSELRKFLSLLAEESSIPGILFFDIHDLAKRHHVHAFKRMGDVLKKLRSKGFKASRTHFIGWGLRTNAPERAVLNALKR